MFTSGKHLMECLLDDFSSDKLNQYLAKTRCSYRPGCSYNRRDISADEHRTGRRAIACTVVMYGHIQGEGVTAYRIYNMLYCEAGEVGPNVTNNRK